jgi:protein-S-isoprenylcysteine O-methyltransferase
LHLLLLRGNLFYMFEKLVLTLLIFAWITWGSLEVWVSVRERGTITKSHDKNSSWVILSLAAVALSGGVLVSQILPIFSISTPTVSRFIGTCIMFCGIIFRIWSINTLGKFFRSTVMIQKGHPVITSGPYRFIRHPSYTGSLLIFSGAGIALNNWLSLLVMVLFMFIAYTYRVAIEEKTLAGFLGKEYLAYQRRTKRFLPMIF